MQDAEVASLRLAELATGDAHLPAATIFVMGGVAERHRREVERLLERLPRVARIGGRSGASCASSWSAAGPRPRRPCRRSAPRCAPLPGRRQATEAEPGRPHPADRRSPRSLTPRSAPPRPARRPGAHGPWPTDRPVRPGGRAASSPMTTRGCSVTMKWSSSVSRKLLDVGPDVGEVRLAPCGPGSRPCSRTTAPSPRRTRRRRRRSNRRAGAGAARSAPRGCRSCSPRSAGRAPRCQCAWNSAGVRPSLRRSRQVSLTMGPPPRTVLLPSPTR